MKRIFLFLFAAVTLAFLATLAHIRSFSDAHATAPADCIVVFGAAVWEDDRPSHALRDRMASGIDLFQRGLSGNCLILSGGPSASGARHEVDIMTEMAVAASVPTEAVTRDYDGTNTLATVRNLDAGTSHILVSNDFHLARIMLFARRADLTSTPHAAPYITIGHYTQEAFFTFREIIALWFYGFHLNALR